MTAPAAAALTAMPCAFTAAAAARLQRQHNRRCADTAVHCCLLACPCRKGWLDGVKLLLAAGAEADLPNKRGLSALGEAIAGGHVEAAEALVAAGADPSWRASG